MSPSRPSHHTRLDAVSCSAADACAAVGVFAEGLGNPTKGYYAALIMRTHNGSDWYRMLPGAVVSSWAKGVSCTTTDLCVVVGSLYPRAGGERPLIFRKTGPLIYDWARVPVPGSNTRGLTDVSCVTSQQCHAVGRRGEGALVLATTDGTTWTPQASHAPLGTQLASVSCRGLTCTAVGVRPRPLPSGGSVAATFAQPGEGDGASIIRTTDGSNWSSLTVSQRDPATPASVSLPGQRTVHGSRRTSGSDPAHLPIAAAARGRVTAGAGSGHAVRTAERPEKLESGGRKAPASPLPGRNPREVGDEQSY